MRSVVILPLPGNEAFAGKLATSLGADLGSIETRHFPDEEAYVRIRSAVRSRKVVLVCSLDRPDPKLPMLLFAADAARDLGATSVGLVAPYLAYMRQDWRFHEGEAISSRSFARVIGNAVDWIVTADPHLHRFKTLGDIYSIPNTVVHTAPLIAEWIKHSIGNALVIGPDAESEQWAAEIAAAAGVPHVVGTKRRTGDRDVSIELPDLTAFPACQPVLVDDVISSGRTLIEAASLLQQAGFSQPACAVVHPLFSAGAFAALQHVARIIVSTDTIPHPSNALGTCRLFAGAVSRMLNPEDPGSP
jgi:ribose-phosphate pyrophosphokinase